MKPFYREILKEAWRVISRQRFLWIFGIFAAVWGNGGVYDVVFNYSNLASKLSDLKASFLAGGINQFLNNLNDYFAISSWAGAFVLIIALAIFCLLIWLVMVSQAALIDAAKKLKEGQKASAAESFKVGKKVFWPVLSLNLLNKLVTYGLLIVVGIPLFAVYLTSDNILWPVILSLYSFLILVPGAIIISFIALYATIFIVVKKYHLAKAIAEAWHLFIKNWLVSLEMAFVLLVINFLASLAAFVAMTVCLIPFVLFGLLFNILGSAAGFWIVIILALIVIVLILILMASLIASFQVTAWTLLFSRLVEGRGTSKIMRWFSGRLNLSKPQKT